MPAIVILGAQWGDEGKGKATDLLGHHRARSTTACAPAAATTPATRSWSTARSSPPTCCPAASSPRAAPRSSATAWWSRPEALFRELDALDRPRRGHLAAVVSANAHVIASYHSTHRQGHRAVPRQEPDRHHRPRDRAGVRRQDQPDRHPGRGPVRRGDPARQGRGRPRRARTTCWPRSTTGARSEADEVVDELLSYADRLRPMVADTSLLLNRGARRGPRRCSSRAPRPPCSTSTTAPTRS